MDLLWEKNLRSVDFNTTLLTQNWKKQGSWTEKNYNVIFPIDLALGDNFPNFLSPLHFLFLFFASSSSCVESYCNNNVPSLEK